MKTSYVTECFSSINKSYLKKKKKKKSALYPKWKCCEFKGKQASKIESTSLCCRSFSVLHVIDQKNEWSVCVE